MILINTTFAVDPAIKSRFLQWISDTFIPEARTTVDGSGFLLTRILKPASAAPEAECEEELTYACQFRVSGMEEAGRWLDHFSVNLLRDSATRWGSALLQFTTLMEIIETA